MAPNNSTQNNKKGEKQIVIGVSVPADGEILDSAALEKFLHDRIKVDGKPGQVGDAVKIPREAQ